jgi:xanthine dehydrogenase accessory factor
MVIRDFFATIAEAAGSDQPCWLATVVTSTGSTPARIGMKMVVFADGTIRGTIGGGELEKSVIEKIRSEQPATEVKWGFDLGSNTGAEFHTAMVCGGVQEILVERLNGGTSLYIFGGGHCGVALSWLAPWAGFDVTVFDNRPEWATPEKHPRARKTVCGQYEDIASTLSVPPDAYVAIMTHGHKHDGVVLRQMLRLQLKYLGLIGSAKKVRELFHTLEGEGIAPDVLKKVHAPIGIPIGSHTPEEVAVSIVAELIAQRSRETAP